MLETILDLEKKLIRVETWLLVACVVTMLVLAGYNVAYRNLLVPWQTQLLTSGPPVTTEAESPASDEAETPEGPAAEDGAAEESGDDFAGGFGAPAEEESADETEGDGGFEGGFGAPAEGSDGAEADTDSEGDFEGGFGAPAEEDEGDDEIGGGFDAPAEEDESDDEIGGGFGAADDVESDGAKGSDDESAEEVDAAAVAEEAAEEVTEPTGGPPPEGSFADTMVGVIDAMKLAWIDILLRQMVIITGFLGAMLAARRRNHITIDAVGKLLEGRSRHIVDAITSSVSVGVCVVLALAGWDLVKIGLEYPSELLPWAEEWTFQLAFPVGFGLLALHFAIRIFESIMLAIEDETLDDEEGGDSGDAAAAEAAAGGAV